MTFDDIATRFARGQVPNSEYLALTGDLSRLGFRLFTPPGAQRHEWSKGRTRLRLSYHAITRTWTRDAAIEAADRSPRSGRPVVVQSPTL